MFVRIFEIFPLKRGFLGLICGSLLALSLAACSSDGGSSSNPSNGGMGTGGISGETGGASNGTGGSAGSSSGVCSSLPDRYKSESTCTSAATNCSENSQCVAIACCVGNCPLLPSPSQQQCVDNCWAAHADGASTFRNLCNCGSTFCAPPSTGCVVSRGGILRYCRALPYGSTCSGSGTISVTTRVGCPDNAKWTCHDFSGFITYFYESAPTAEDTYICNDAPTAVSIPGTADAGGAPIVVSEACTQYCTHLASFACVSATDAAACTHDCAFNYRTPSCTREADLYVECLSLLPLACEAGQLRGPVDGCQIELDAMVSCQVNALLG